MKKPFKIMSSTALAAVFASSAIIPVAAAETPAVQQSVESVIVVHDNKNVKISLSDYLDLMELDKVSTPTNIVLSNGDSYSVSEYLDFFELNDDMDSTVTALVEGGTTVTVENVVEGSVEDGELVTEDETPEEKVNETFFYNFAA